MYTKYKYTYMSNIFEYKFEYNFHILINWQVNDIVSLLKSPGL